MLELLAKDFKDRAALESFVRNKFDLTPDKKPAVIIGTVAELSNLRLSARTTFWGISCRAIDLVVGVVSKPPQRGDFHPFGINNDRVTKKPKIKKNQKKK